MQGFRATSSKLSAAWKQLSQSMEIHSRWRWQQLWGQISSGFKNVVTSTAAGSASQFLEQLSGLMVLWIGLHWYSRGNDSGPAHCIQDSCGNVTSPLLRMANLWQNFQEQHYHLSDWPILSTILRNLK